MESIRPVCLCEREAEIMPEEIIQIGCINFLCTGQEPLHLVIECSVVYLIRLGVDLQIILEPELAGRFLELLYSLGAQIIIRVYQTDQLAIEPQTALVLLLAD